MVTDPARGDAFGNSVVLSGDDTVALIGSPGANGGRGVVFAFTLGVGRWRLAQGLTQNDALSPDGVPWW